MIQSMCMHNAKCLMPYRFREFHPQMFLITDQRNRDQRGTWSTGSEQPHQELKPHLFTPKYFPTFKNPNTPQKNIVCTLNIEQRGRCASSNLRLFAPFAFSMAILQIHQDQGFNCSLDKHNNIFYQGKPLHMERMVGKNGKVCDSFR